MDRKKNLSAFKDALKKKLQSNKESNIKVKTDDEYFLEEFKRVNLDGKDLCENPQYEIVPKFYTNLPPENDELKQKLREEARAQFLQRRSRSLLDNDELKKLYSVLEANSSSPEEEFSSICEDNLMDFDAFKKAKSESSAKCQIYFQPMIFAKLQHGDPHGRISVMAFFNYVMRKVWIHQTRIGLSLYDVNGQGFLREQDVENYIAELIETLPQLDGLDKSFHSFYVCTAVRKFFFFLDPLRTGKIKIQDILASSFLDDLLELRDQDLTKDAQDANWFSAPSALRVYGQYLNLDKDHNGMLSRQELLSYGTSTLTQTFIDRVFEECLTYGGEMDYKTYLDFVLALENRKEPQALAYFFKILDVKHQGFLNTFCLNYFFRDLLQQMEKLSQDPVKFEDVKDEIFDMIRPQDPLRIKLDDLIKCGNGDTVVSILIDLNGFWTYENREVLVNDNSEDSSDN